MVEQSIGASDWARIKNYDFDVEAVRNEKKSLYDKMIINDLELKPGAFDLVMDLKENGFKLAIASSSRLESVQLVVDKFFPNLFDVLQSDTELPEGKPNPAIFQVTMNKLLTQPSNTLIIEDSLSGYQAAIDSGACCVICPDSSVDYKGQLFPMAAIVVDSLIKFDSKLIFKLLNS